MNEPTDTPPGRNVFLAFLGANNYAETTYQGLDGFDEPAVTSRFTQIARLTALKSRGVRMDAGYVLVTKDARKCNWAEDAHFVVGPPGKRKRIEVLGLAVALRHEGCGTVVKKVDIDDPNTEANVWGICRQIADLIEPGDRLYVDITHGFRAMPLVLMATLRFVVRAKRAEIAEVTYGAYEYRKRDDPRPRPTWNLAPLLDVNTWAAALDAFVQTADLRPLASLADERSQGSGTSDEQRAFRRLAGDLSRLADALVHADLRYIASDAARARSAIDDVQSLLGPDAEELSAEGAFREPLRIVLGMLDKELNALLTFDIGDDATPIARIGAQLDGVRWTLERGQHMQGLTMLRETLVDVVERHMLASGGFEIGGRLRLPEAERVTGYLGARRRGSTEPYVPSRGDEASQAAEARAVSQWIDRVGTERLYETGDLALKIGHLRNLLDHACLPRRRSKKSKRRLRPRHDDVNVESLELCDRVRTLAHQLLSPDGASP